MARQRHINKLNGIDHYLMRVPLWKIVLDWLRMSVTKTVWFWLSYTSQSSNRRLPDGSQFLAIYVPKDSIINLIICLLSQFFFTRIWSVFVCACVKSLINLGSDRFHLNFNSFWITKTVCENFKPILASIDRYTEEAEDSHFDLFINRCEQFYGSFGILIAKEGP